MNTQRALDIHLKTKPGPRHCQMTLRACRALIEALALILILSVSSKAQDALTNGLVAYYPFAGNANDVWGGLNGEMIGNITPAPDRFGEEGMACNFDGASFVNVPDTPAIHLQAMTISLWVQIDTTSDTVNLVNKDDFGQGYQLFKSGDDSVFFGIGDGSRHNTEGNARITSRQWHHLAATYDLQTIRLFVDGANTDSVAYATIPTYASNSLQIARNGAFGGQYLSGNLSDLRFYNRALSPDEVQQLYSYEASRLPQIALRSVLDAVTPSFSGLTVGGNYQLQVSSDLNSWTNHDSAFIATNTSMVHPQSFDVDQTQQRFFRLSQSAEGRAGN